MRAAIIATAAVLAAACSARPLDGVVSSGSGDASSGGDAGDGITSSSSGSGTDEGPSLENCGDGKVDPGEQCDDGNDVDADGCNVDCVASGSVRWSMQMDGVRCGLLTADRQGGVFTSGRSSETNLHWIARIAEPGEVVWKTPDGPTGHAPAPLIGLPDGVLAGWDRLPSQAQGLVSAYDGPGMQRWETTLDEPDVDGLDFFPHARVANGQDPVLVTHADLTDGNERVTFWHLDADGKVVDARVVAEGSDLPLGDHVVITSDGTILLATSKNSLDSLSAYTPSGQLLWEEPLPDTRDLHDLDSASDGSLYTVSMYSEDVEGPYVNLVERYTPDGVLVQSWVHESMNEGDQGFGDALLAVDGRDDVLVVGRYFNEVEFRYTGFHLVKYSSEGDPRWSSWWEDSQGNNSNFHRPSGLTIAANGDILLAFNDQLSLIPSEDRCHIVAIAP